MQHTMHIMRPLLCSASMQEMEMVERDHFETPIENHHSHGHKQMGDGRSSAEYESDGAAHPRRH